MPAHPLPAATARRLSTTRRRGRSPAALTTLLLATAALLAGCGGGGGDAGDAISVAQAISITAGNRDRVARATAAGLLGLDSTGAGSVTPSAVTRPDMRALALGPLDSVFCNAGGSSSAQLDDRDNNNTPSAGDVLTLAFNNCRDSATDLVNGSTSVTFTRVGLGLPLTLGARLTLNQLAATSGGQTVVLNGQLLMDFTRVSSTLDRFSLTADTAVVAAVQSLNFQDTVTLMPGFVQTTDSDSATGLSSSVMSGSIDSVSAGGRVSVSTPTALLQADSDAYPRAGVVLVSGKTSALRMTVLSNTQLLLELDEDGNGSYETSQTVAWTYLL